MTGLHDCVLERGACLKHFGAIFVKDRPAARSSVHVALIGDGKVGVIYPLNPVWLTQPVFLMSGKEQCRAFVDGVNLVKIDRAR